MNADTERVAPRRRGIYLLPNLLTTGALFAGFYSIVAAIDGNFQAAAWAIFIAMFLDGLDGRVARLMTVSVRPGRPNGAASSFLSGIIREPLAGQEAVCPVSPVTCTSMTPPREGGRWMAPLPRTTAD